MTDREKLLKAAKCCLTIDPTAYDPCPKECPYREKIGKPCGFDPFLADIVSYLEAQEPIKPRFYTGRECWCGQCGSMMYAGDDYCSHCGRRIKWDD